MSLSAFLAQNAKKVENAKYVASKRFVDSDGNPMEWELKCLESSEDEILRKSCTQRVQVKLGKRNQFIQETNYSLYAGKLAAECTVHPNLNDVELQNSYEVMGSEALLKAMLTPGEYADYLNKVQEVNGFEISFEEDVDEAKNS